MKIIIEATHKPYGFNLFNLVILDDLPWIKATKHS